LQGRAENPVKELGEGVAIRVDGMLEAWKDRPPIDEGIRDRIHLDLGEHRVIQIHIRL
jgi:hypothetical protein